MATDGIRIGTTVDRWPATGEVSVLLKPTLYKILIWDKGVAWSGFLHRMIPSGVVDVPCLVGNS